MKANSVPFKNYFWAFILLLIFVALNVVSVQFLLEYYALKQELLLLKNSNAVMNGASIIPINFFSVSIRMLDGIIIELIMLFITTFFCFGGIRALLSKDKEEEIYETPI